MTSADLKSWRALMGLTQQGAADALGLSRRVYQYYEKGRRIPKSVALACTALYHKLDPWPPRHAIYGTVERETAAR